MSVLADQVERDRFVTAWDRNISVIAPAGVGKTTSLVERIVSMAKSTRAEEILPRLIVVTYSVRAAQEMQQRARTAIRKASVSSRVQRAFQQTFFGTIHSYCVKLLDRFGHYLGLPAPMALLESDDELWNRFLVRGLATERFSDARARELFHFFSAEKLYALGREIAPGKEARIEPMPELDWKRLFDFRDNQLSGPTKKSIERAQDAARQWRDSWARGERHRPLPKCPASEHAAAFAAVWSMTFVPLEEWLRQSALAFGRSVANAYERFRLNEGGMTYDDQVRLALRALDLPAVRRELAAEQLSVLLDEAQDTDPRQFEVLLRVAGLGSNPDQAESQSFSVVGDFQQAIYAPRSDLNVYRRVHDEISTGSRGTTSRLAVTFRCDRAIIDWVNRIFPSMLDNAAGQCAFVTLKPRAEAGPGQVVHWTCPDEPAQAAGEKINAEKRVRHEAKWLAKRIAELSPGGLGARDWSQVAVLCPRRNWLLDLERELLALDLPVQLHSSNEEHRERTPVAWLTSLLWIAAHPEDSFEIAGVLREIFGVPDDDMALFTDSKGDRLRLDQPEPEGTGTVEIALKLLRGAFADAEKMPLSSFVGQVVTRTNLRERIDSIPELKLEDAGKVLDDFLAAIWERCAQGVTLTDLARDMKRALTQARPGEEEIRNAIQLLTSHKAKGLEWETVIIPYVFRSIESKNIPYPRLIQGEEGREIICRDAADFSAQAQNFVTTREKQQLQRLLYVMCTRAKRALVLVDDEILFAGQRRPGWPAGVLLKLTDGANREAWKELPETLSGEEPVPVVTVEGERFDFFRSVTLEDRQKAIERAQLFTKRITPHALAVHSREEAELEKAIEKEDGQDGDVRSNPGIRYGTWWHEFVRTIPWGEPVEAWQQKFEAAQARSPEPDRSQREWEVFLGSDLAQWLAAPGRLIRTEIPFLWSESAGSCLEGVIDLAVYSESESSWRVIDWKTNRIGPEGGAAIAEIYREQIRAYVRALRGMMSAEVRGGLYLTSNGEWLDL
ncbi:MAG: UvrD-helicase domain-containing protein [Methylacidiphilales bacterium]|nr:UvrD-helicase domain-containing protein [Candidatus Methylacidiphilales bacterium]